jgi:biopolymer transport protein ExbD
MDLKAEFSQDEDIDMSPMIDMVFLLIIFFMVASHFNKIDSPEIDLPIASNARTPEDLEGRRNITVLKNGDMLFGSVPIKVDEIEPKIKKTIKYIPKLKIYLRAHQNTPHKHVRKVMEKCAEAGAYHIVFATYEKE